MINANKTLSLAVMSGKGGVGKTNLSLNLSYALNAGGNSLLLMDCDLGLANLDVLLGISPESNMQDLLISGAKPSDVVIPIEEGKKFDILPAASGVPELVEMDEDMQEMLFSKISKLVGRYQYLVMDLGAGINSTVLSFATIAQMRFVVITPEPTSLTDSYALIKVLHTQHKVSDFNIIVNQATTSKEAKDTFDRLNMACEKFLNIKLKNIGFVRYDPAVTEAVRRQIPFLKYAPKSEASRDILNIAVKIQKIRMENMGKLGDRPVIKKFPDLST
ncbi:MinD/ParA family protein [Maridesulfovibrio ferrireducens]|uniref:MinD/ParA family protein n=1 Tax=Maridesulfovibrio ferrireducens TaxID=246191 RepID=UPI001A2C85CB|nr:MinD/ParA family protein [Maridesulfovibrio ferrireducens]MBI9110453.1 MinD/ParA family protein [Maridesulfovibrio ferrireducens]